MRLSSGTFVGFYEILGPLGSGGMGEVYRARDTRLKRDVALKVLPSALVTDSERVDRLQREAELLAAMNHPGIAAIYGLEEAHGFSALILELVDGETLAERVVRGRVAERETLSIARQLVDAFDAAHEHGIVHRDLKAREYQDPRRRHGQSAGFRHRQDAEPLLGHSNCGGRDCDVTSRDGSRRRHGNPRRI